jgi:hypothetical protein
MNAEATPTYIEFNEHFVDSIFGHATSAVWLFDKEEKSSEL